MTRLTLSGLTKSYPGAGAATLHGLSLAVASGQMTALLGPSGSGKTTIVDLLLGLIPPSGGRILLGGVPLAEVDVWAWRRKIGYVPQELNLFHASVRDNIIYRTSGAGIHLWHDASNVTIRGNTVAGCGTGIVVGGGDF